MATPHRSYVIYTADGKVHETSAPSARKALCIASRDIDEAKTPILAVVDARCLAQPDPEAGPFLAAFLVNRHFTPPDLV